MCPPVNGSREEVCPGRHTGRPLRFSQGSHQPREERAGTEPRPYRPTRVPSNGPMWASAPTGRKGGPIDRPGQRRRAERLRRGWEEWVGIAAEVIPKVSSNLGQSLCRGEAATAPFAQGSLWPAGDEKAGGHIGPPLRGHRSAQQRQAGRDRARPLQKDGEYAEGWGDERAQGRFDIYQAVIGLVSHKAQCPE